MAGETLFRDLNPFGPAASPAVSGMLARGSLVAFRYPASRARRPTMIHDPYPLVIVTDVWPTAIRGVNLHYLTFPYIRRLLSQNCGNPSYSYFQVRADAFLAQAFRMYYRNGMMQVRVMDCSFIQRLMTGIRSWSESEIEHVKTEIRAQIGRKLQMKASELAQANQPPMGVTPEGV